MNINVSLGEIYDKYTILLLKLEHSSNNPNNLEIQKEINVLQPFINLDNFHYDYYLTLLKYVNSIIMHKTDEIYSLHNDNSPSFFIQHFHLASSIFSFNKQRFRIKNFINILDNSFIKEQKTYHKTHCIIVIPDKYTFYNKLPHINYLSLLYDAIYLDIADSTVFIYDILELLKTPIFSRLSSHLDVIGSNTDTINLDLFTINDTSIINTFTYKPLTYINTGKLGDLILSLSTIHQMFEKTGRMGNLSICGDKKLLSRYRLHFQ